MKHLLLVTTSFPVNHDGSEAAGSFVYDLASILSDKIKITVVAPGRLNNREEISASFSVVRFTAPNKPLSLLKIKNPLHWMDIIRTLKSGQEAVQKVVDQEPVDHILAFWVLPSGYWAQKASAKAGIPYSTWALGSDIWTLWRIPVVKRLLYKVLLASSINYADGVELRRSVNKISGRECFFLPSARRLEDVGGKVVAEEPPYRLTYLGRWHENKGIDILLDSLFLLNDSDWKLIQNVKIFGGGNLDSYVHEKAKILQKNGCPVQIGNYVDKNESIKLLMGSDYVMIPSRIESIPLIFSDSMRCRCPVVCTPAGDLENLVKEYNVGIVSSGFTPEYYCDSLKYIIRKRPSGYIDDMDEVSSIFCLDNISKSILNSIA